MAQVAKMQKLAIPAADMYRPPNVAEGVYSEWDERGMPTKDGQGVELTKSAVKKLGKAFDVQVKGNAEYEKWAAAEKSA